MINYYAAIILILMTLGFTTGCSRMEPYIGQDVVVESSQRRAPKWVTSPPKPDRRTIYFVGQETSSDKIDSYAYQQALAQISQFIATRATALYTQTQTSQDTDLINQYRNNYIQTLSQSSVRGALRKDSYWEYVTVKESDTNSKQFYRYYVLVGISKKDLLASEKATLEMQLSVTDESPINQTIQTAINKINQELESL